MKIIAVLRIKKQMEMKTITNYRAKSKNMLMGEPLATMKNRKIYHNYPNQ
jgi:hypothetical protein